MITRDKIREAVDVQGTIDRLVTTGTPLDSHPLEVSGEETAWLDESLCRLVLRWRQRRGVKIE